MQTLMWGRSSPCHRNSTLITHSNGLSRRKGLQEATLPLSPQRAYREERPGTQTVGSAHRRSSSCKANFSQATAPPSPAPRRASSRGATAGPQSSHPTSPQGHPPLDKVGSPRIPPPIGSRTAGQKGAEWGVRTLRQACCQEIPGSAMCVQNFNDSRGLAIRITYRISLRSSSLWEPRHPLLKVV